VVRTLLVYAADANAKDTYDRTAFILAITNGQVETVDALLVSKSPLPNPPKIRPVGDKSDERPDSRDSAKPKAKAKTRPSALVTAGENITGTDDLGSTMGSSATLDRSPSSTLTQTIGAPGGKKSLASSARSQDLAATTGSMSLKKAMGKEVGASPKIARTKTGDTGEGKSGKKATIAADVKGGGGVSDAIAKRRAKMLKHDHGRRGAEPTSLITAAIARRDEVVKKPIGYPVAGAVIRQLDKDGRNPLQLAVSLQRTTIVHKIFEAKGDHSASDNEGVTVLMEATRTKQRDIVTILLERNARVDAKDKKGRIAIDVCEDEVIRHMLERRLVSERVPDLDAPIPPDSADGVPGSQQPVFRTRFEQLPLQLTEETLEKHIRYLLGKLGAGKPLYMEVVIDPVRSRPKGHAYADFSTAAAADLAVRGDGLCIAGQEVRIFKEVQSPMRQHSFV
jgi:ankyrin repeat protein